MLKSERAERATLAIVEAYAQLRSMVRDMEALQALKDGSPEQAAHALKMDFFPEFRERRDSVADVNQTPVTAKLRKMV